MFGKSDKKPKIDLSHMEQLTKREDKNRILKIITNLFSNFFNLVLIGGILGTIVLYGYVDVLPDYKQLSQYKPKMVSRLYAADGRFLEEYAKEKRIFVPIEAIPNQLINAFLAAEDRNFYEHEGIDLKGITRALFKNLSNIGTDRGLVGGSTITQQVVKNFLLSSEKKLERKIKEAILAMRISQVFSKEKVLELYLNEIYLGAGSYGVAAASLNYFNKSINELNISEMAMLAALPKAPSSYDPKRDYEKAKQRRDWVIGEMQEVGYISAEEAQKAIARPIELAERDETKMVSAPVFAEEVRRRLVEMYDEDKVYQGGLTVKSTINAKMQKTAEDALLEGIATYDKRHGYKGAVEKIEDIENWNEKLKEIEIQGLPEEWKKAVVLEVKEEITVIGLAEGSEGEILLNNVEWAKPRDLMREWERVQKQFNSNVNEELALEWQEKLAINSSSDIFAKGDVILVSKENTEVEEGTRPFYTLQQIPDANGALVAMDPHTGRVLAMVGGLKFRDTAFNRATQARRQPGSAFKTFVYLTALENGFSPNTLIMDEPIVLKRGGGSGVSWRPQNYSGEFYGPTPMRIGLEKSRNVTTIQLAKRVGLNPIEQTGVRFGIYDELPPNDYSTILGSAETTLLKLTNAYAMIVNGGKRVNPSIIETIQDKEGNIIYRRDKRLCEKCTFNNEFEIVDEVPPVFVDNREQVVDPQTAYQTAQMLRGVVLRGTGIRAKWGLSDYVVAGKTGTTNASMDTWFIGFTPDLVCGVFVGYDTPRTLGNKETGSNVALPIFIDFMKEALKGKPSIPFRVPEGISIVNIDGDTGLLPSENTTTIIEEAFKVGNEPTEESDYTDWQIRYEGKDTDKDKIEEMIRDGDTPTGTGGIY